MKIILLIFLLILIYEAGKMSGEKETFLKVKKYIKISRDWNEWEI